ncbi:MAG: DUF4294 domain-containing protein [Flavobacteriales bacterium]|nr:DUF4294 domain-containing protein [Flavobacteriales bacterium]
MTTIIFVLLLAGNTSAQDTTLSKVLRAEIIDGDTVLFYDLRSVNIYEERVFASVREKKKYSRLKRDVMKVYPYAKLAGEKLREYESQMDSLKNDREKKKFLKQVEQDLQDEFGDELTNLSIKQGTILLTLVDRETGDTSYELVKQLRGVFSAFFWQSLARLFGHNLKDGYDSDGDQEMIEDIILRIENGEYSLTDAPMIIPTPHMEPRVH